MDRHFLQACILFDQGRYDLAEEKLRLSLAEEPDHSLAHALLADCLRQSDKLKEATAEAREAVRLDPELAQAHAALARVLSDRNYHADADAAAREAIRIDPDDADYRALLAAMLIERRDWQAALDAAEAGLELDAEHTGCSNLRSMALVKLGRNQEAREIGESALARDPHDAFSHASQGWALLNAGDRGKALEHFREALRLEPGMEYARLGIVEALKAQHLIYALMLRYFLWMGRLGRTVQWAIILGGYFGYRILYDLKEKNPALSPWINPLLVAYFIFAIMTWLASPLFNLMLRLNKFGRHILSREQTLESNFIGVMFALALPLAGVWLLTDNDLALLGAIYVGLLLLPVRAIFICSAGWPREAMIIYTLALVLAGPAWFGLILCGWGNGANSLIPIFIWGCALSGIAANFLMMQQPRR